jgi:hypothetical protein
MSRSKMTRRDWLKLMGTAAWTLPLLEALPGLQSRAEAAPAGFGGAPRRFVVMWTPNGTVPDRWKCSGTETNFQFSTILEPLTPHKQDVLVLDGLAALSAYEGPGDAHQKGTGQCLTGRQLQTGNFQGAGGLSSGWADGISVDQAAVPLAGGTRLGSLELGVFNAGANVNSRISYSGPAQPLPAENDPRRVFDRLFGNPNENSGARTERIARRRSVLDAVTDRFKRLSSEVSSADRMKLDAHLTSLRELEKRVLSDGFGACTPTGGPPAVSTSGINNLPAVGKAQMDLLASALACDATRVATLMWMNSATDKTYPWVNVHEAHHELAHRGDADLDAKDKLTRIYNWYAQQFAYLVAKLKSIPEGGGTLLDNTFVIWVSEHSKGNTHDRHHLPYVAAGKGGGAVRPGRLLNCNDAPHNNLWVSCLQMMGSSVNTFGSPQYCSGPLSGLS